MYFLVHIVKSCFSDCRINYSRDDYIHNKLSNITVTQTGYNHLISSINSSTKEHSAPGNDPVDKVPHSHQHIRGGLKHVKCTIK